MLMNGVCAGNMCNKAEGAARTRRLLHSCKSLMQKQRHACLVHGKHAGIEKQSFDHLKQMKRGRKNTDGRIKGYRIPPPDGLLQG